MKLRPYAQKLSELSVENDILLWGHRVVVPLLLTDKVLKSVHQSHLGIVKTKSLLRSYVWWPKMDNDVETMIKRCEACLSVLSSPPKSPNIDWEIPDGPMERIHMDYAGPVRGLYLFIVIDAYSKWVEVFTTKFPSAIFTVKCLRYLFSRFGNPRKTVSDNGAQFSSSAFKQFLDQRGIKHVYTAPGYPATNGAAENAVRTVKML